jgi:hypothetical protein
MQINERDNFILIIRDLKGDLPQNNGASANLDVTCKTEFASDLNLARFIWITPWKLESELLNTLNEAVDLQNI